MHHIVVSVVAALAISIAAYTASGSFVLAFLGYVAGGTSVLMMALAAGVFFDDRGDDEV